MSQHRERVERAFAHQAPDRTPLFEIFSPFHPIYWDIAGRNPATDMGLLWDALADNIDADELLTLSVDAQFEVNRHFEVDMVRLNGAPQAGGPRPVKTGPDTWTLDGVRYYRNPHTDLVVLEDPAADASYSHRFSEASVRRQLEEWDGSAPDIPAGPDPVIAGVQARASAAGIDWVYMGEVGAGTGVAFYPPFLLMWMLDEPELYARWLERQKLLGLALTRRLVESGCTVIAMGGDVSCDKGPFISPALYDRFILPVIQEHVDLIHALGARAVYTSDGNHWPIADALFHRSGIDGYKEVDQAAGMTWPRLIEAGVAERVCIVGNLDARHNLCHGTPESIRREVIGCLEYGRRTPGGHILHASHSVHEDMPSSNYIAAVNAYRAYFDMPALPR